MEGDRRVAERRQGADRRTTARRSAYLMRRPLWQEQRNQFVMRYLLLGFGFVYFNFGPAPRALFFSVLAVNLILVGYFLAVTACLALARRWRESLAPVRVAMAVDLVWVSFVTAVDPAVVSPAMLIFLIIILGNGMRYGTRLLAEALAGSFVLCLAVAALRWPDIREALSINTVYFFLLGVIVALYAWALTRGLERARGQIEAERSVDLLTGLLNRRALYERAGTLFERLRQEPAPIVLLFGDLDRFKQVNDRLGHHVGDQVLAKVGRLFAGAVRGSDIVARFGGDEFVFVLPATDLEHGTLVARRLQRLVTDWAQAEGVDISLSLGLGQAPQHGHDLKSLIARVDQAMYQGRQVNGPGGILRVEDPAQA